MRRGLAAGCSGTFEVKQVEYPFGGEFYRTTSTRYLLVSAPQGPQRARPLVAARGLPLVAAVQSRTRSPEAA